MNLPTHVAVGLLWGRSAACTAASPIVFVLAAFGVNMVGVPEDIESAVEGAGAQVLSKSIDQVIAALDLVQSEKVREAISIKRGYEQGLLQLENVAGIGVGLPNERTTPVITIFLKEDDPETHARIPSEIDGVPTHIIVSGPFRFLSGPSDGSPVTQHGSGRQTR